MARNGSGIVTGPAGLDCTIAAVVGAAGNAVSGQRSIEIGT